MGFAKLMVACAALGFAAAARAQAPDQAMARIEAVQPPAWVLREGQRAPAAPGAVLQAGDAIETGAGGRVHLAASEGSSIKLGERGQMQLPELHYVATPQAPAPGSGQGIYTATLKILKGAFRFTTSALGHTFQRDITVDVGPTVTAGVRGTDIWGKSGSDKDLLCLIDGRVEVGSGQGSVVMDQPRTYYVVPRGRPPLAVQPVPDAIFDQWYPQTDLQPGEPALYADGAWSVAVASKHGEAAARRRQGQLAARGLPAQVLAGTSHGRQVYRVVVPGLRSAADAAAFARVLGRRFGYRKAQVVAPG